MTDSYSGSEYMEAVLNPDLLIEETKNSVKELKHLMRWGNSPGADKLEFDAIAFRGMSGALRAPLLAIKLKKSLIMVRKSRKNNHSGRYVEGNYGAKTYIIVDDLMCTGMTAKMIVRRIKEAMPDAKCVGFYTAQYGGSFRDEEGLRKRKIIK
jgi:orotate phosphoribosyltransferase